MSAPICRNCVTRAINTVVTDPVDESLHCWQLSKYCSHSTEDHACACAGQVAVPVWRLQSSTTMMFNPAKKLSSETTLVDVLVNAIVPWKNGSAVTTAGVVDMLQTAKAINTHATNETQKETKKI